MWSKRAGNSPTWVFFKVLQVFISASIDPMDSTKRSFSQTRCNQLGTRNVFVAYLGDTTNRFTKTNFKLGRLNTPGNNTRVVGYKKPNRTAHLSSCRSLNLVFETVLATVGVKLLDNFSKPREAAEVVHTKLKLDWNEMLRLLFLMLLRLCAGVVSGTQTVTAKPCRLLL